MKKHRFKKNDGLKPILILFVMITCGAVIIGYFGTRYFVYPIFIKEPNAEITDLNSGQEQNQDSKTQPIESSKKEEVSARESENNRANEFHIYHVQLGNFTAKENANLLISELEKGGIYAYILGSDGFKVVTTPVANYEQAETLKNCLIDYAQDAFILKRKVNVENTSVETTITNVLYDLNEARAEPEGQQWIQKLKSAFQDGLADSQMEQETIKTFQKIYDEVNKIETLEKNDLFEMEKKIIIMVEEII